MKKSYCQISFECTLPIDEQHKCKHYFVNHMMKENGCIYNMIGICTKVEARNIAIEYYHEGIVLETLEKGEKNEE